MTTGVSNAKMGITAMLFAMFFISLNDMLVKTLSGGYPLHQIVFIRSAIGICLGYLILRYEGGLVLLRTAHWRLHTVRALCVVFANSCLYAAIASMPLATANALYFVAPLLVTLLSVPILGEQVGPRRLIAVLVGFGGVLLMLSPQLRGGAGSVGWVAVLPLLAASGYATASVLTRRLGQVSRASALAMYMQMAFLVISVVSFSVLGDGKFLAAGMDDSLAFILRAWVWPETGDWPPLIALGCLSAIVGYLMSQAYRLANASVVAPFEYILLIYALFWGWTVFNEWPAPEVLMGAGVIIAAGVYIFLRERRA